MLATHSIAVVLQHNIGAATAVRLARGRIGLAHVRPIAMLQISNQRRAHEELSGERTTRNKALLQPKEVFLRYRS